MGGLLNHQRAQTGSRCRERRGHAATAGPDDEYVDHVIEGGHVGGHFGRAVLMAKPAISSATGR